MKITIYYILVTGLPHTQGTQENSGNFKIIENLREIQGFLIFFKLQAVLFFFKVSGKF